VAEEWVGGVAISWRMSLIFGRERCLVKEKVSADSTMKTTEVDEKVHNIGSPGDV